MMSNLQKTIIVALSMISIVNGLSVSFERRKEHQAGDLPRMNGVNMAGLEFGMGTNGDKSGNPPYPPPLDQIPHFVKQGLNVIRFPIGWQYIQPEVKQPLNTTYLSILDQYVKKTTKLGAHAIVDLHNYGRRDGQIIGESSLGADTLVDLWTKLAAHYKDQPKVIFGLMNEPHDLTSKVWFDVLQQVVTAIRKQGSNNNILLPGNNWQHFQTFADDYKNGLSAIKNPDGSHTGLIFDIHQYFDQDGSGTNLECNQDHIQELQTVSDLLKQDKRQVLITEMGGGNSQSCVDYVSKFVKAASTSPSIIGVVIWAAGSFDQSYTLVITVKEGNGWKDQMTFEAMKKALPPATKNSA
ncbi:family 5 glycoside hydrolase [Melampsora americana]|nr:family 5 glycoside hydrolase [Melampsora americana]